MARMFISYSRANRVFVEELVPLLTEVFSDHEIWFDKQISGGEDWWQRILEEITRCDVFIYLMSNDSLASEYCQAEFREALRLQKLCLPVIVQPKTEISTAPETLEREIRRREWVDMSGGFRDYQGNARLYAAINRLLSHLPQGSLPPLSGEPVRKPDVSIIRRRVVRQSNSRRAVTIIAVIGLIGVISIVIIIRAIGLPDNPGAAAVIQPTESSSPTLTDVPTATTTPSIMPTLNTDTPTPTATFKPSNTPTLSREILASTPVVSNAVWRPFSHTFNGVEMVLIPAGCFKMGNDPQAYYRTDGAWIKGVPDGGQQCFDKPFWIDRYEVTNEQFTHLNGVANHPGDWSGPRQPYTNITWFEARDFCEKNREARLPTEREWEYAARGPDGLMYPWGNDFVADNGVYSKNSEGRTADVGSKSGGASWVGAHDLAGNVVEWVSSVYKGYPYNPRDGREDEKDEVSGRVFRGGSWYDDGAAMRAANRDSNNPNIQSPRFGFRCAQSY